MAVAQIQNYPQTLVLAGDTAVSGGDPTACEQSIIDYLDGSQTNKKDAMMLFNVFSSQGDHNPEQSLGD